MAYGIKRIEHDFRIWFDNRWPSHKLTLINTSMMDLLSCALNLERDNQIITHLTLDVCKLLEKDGIYIPSVREIVKASRLKNIEIQCGQACRDSQHSLVGVSECCEGILIDSKDLESLTVTDILPHSVLFQKIINVVPQMHRLRSVKFTTLPFANNYTWIQKLCEMPLLSNLTLRFGSMTKDAQLDELAKLISGENRPIKTPNQLYQVTVQLKANTMESIMKAFENGFKSSQCYIGKLRIKVTPWMKPDDLLSLQTALCAASRTLRHLEIIHESMVDHFLEVTHESMVDHFLEVWIAVLKCVPLETVQVVGFHNVNLNVRARQRVMTQLSETKTLTNITLNNLIFDEEACGYLGKLLMALQNLTELTCDGLDEYEPIEQLSSSSIKNISDGIIVNKSLTRLSLWVDIRENDLQTIFWPAVKRSSILDLRLGLGYQGDDMIQTVMKNRQNHATAWVSPCFILSFLRANYDHIYRDSACPLDTVILQLLGENSSLQSHHRARIVKTKFAHNICSSHHNAANSILGKRKILGL
jgi:hypothetical protein